MIVGRLDKCFAGLFEVRRMTGNDVGNLGIVQFAGETVGGKKKDIAGTERLLSNVYGYRQLSADCAGDDVADGRELRLLTRDEASLDLFLDDGVIRRELLETAVAEQVAAAVADMRDPCGVCSTVIVNEHGHEGCAHAVERAVFLCALKNGEVGSADSLLEAGLRVIRGGNSWTGRPIAAGLDRRHGTVSNAVQERLKSQIAGEFTGRGSAHAVADDKNAVFGGSGAGVLVFAADAAGMGSHGAGDCRCAGAGG